MILLLIYIYLTSLQIVKSELNLINGSMNKAVIADMM